MFVAEVNCSSMEMSPQEDTCNSDAENVEVGPDERIIPEDKYATETHTKTGENGRNWTIAKVQVGYDITRKGERSLVVDGFKFTKSRDGTNNRIFWRCSRRECKATAVTVCDRVEHVRAIHAHEPPLAAEFFGNQEGAGQRGELQEVRFNTTAANMRPRFRRSATDDNVDEQPAKQQLPPPIEETQPPVVPPVYSRTPSVKEQVREFILRNSAAASQQDKVSVTQFLIAPAIAQSQQQPPCATPLSAGGGSPTTIFSFNQMHINSPQADSPNEKSTPGIINNNVHLACDSPYRTRTIPDQPTNPTHVQLEQLLHLLVKNGAGRQRSMSDSDWATQEVMGIPSQDDSNIYSAPHYVEEPPTPRSPSRLIHWKKEKLRESELSDPMKIEPRKRRYDTISCAESPTTGGLDTFMSSFRPAMTAKLMGVMQKLGSELTPEGAVAQDIFEKCTAIKTCLETLEKLHSLTPC